MAQLRYIWVISSSVTQIKSSDTFGIFKDPTIDNEKKTITIDTDSSVSLSKDSTVDLMGNMKFRVADSDDLRFYPMVEYEILAPGVTPTPTIGVDTPVVTPVKTPAVNVTVNVTVPPVNVTAATAVATTAPAAAATPTPTKTEPGFEAILAIAGLLAVAFLVLRQRK
jgi:PGF-CTERM protein